LSAFKHKGIRFVYGPNMELQNDMSNMGMKQEDVPALSIQNLTSGKKYLAAEIGDKLTDDAIEAFIKSYLDGTAPPAYKSEPVPSEPEEPKDIRTVVQKTIEAEVEKAETDVLLDWHTDHPKHKDLLPALELAAKGLKAPSPGVKVVQLHADKNEDLKVVYGDGWTIRDSQAEKPADWDTDSDGEWEAPVLNNPAPCTLALVKKGSIASPSFLTSNLDKNVTAQQIIEFCHEHASEPKFDKAAALAKVEQILKEEEEEKQRIADMIAEEEAELEAYNKAEEEKKEEL